MKDLKAYLNALKIEKAILVSRRKVVVDQPCENLRVVYASHNAKIKIQTNTLDVCINHLNRYIKGGS